LISAHITGLNNNPVTRHLSTMIAIRGKIVGSNAALQAVNCCFASPDRKLDFFS
jgi:hypothetical protein